MTSTDLARSYLAKARARLEALAVLRDHGAHSTRQAYGQAAWVVGLASRVIDRLAP